MKLDKIHNTTNLKSCHSKFLQLLCSVRRALTKIKGRVVARRKGSR
jgi:hypothetical protein